MWLEQHGIALHMHEPVEGAASNILEITTKIIWKSVHLRRDITRSIYAINQLIRISQPWS